MPSHAAIEVVAVAGGATPGRVRATLVLACGCTVTQEIAADRILEDVGGGVMAVGKYVCPVGHAVTPR